MPAAILCAAAIALLGVLFTLDARDRARAAQWKKVENALCSGRHCDIEQSLQ
jgi:hypothetical protein